MKKLLSYLATILTCSFLLACGGGADNPTEVATTSSHTTAVVAESLPVVAVSVPAVASTSEVLDSLKVTNGLFVDSDMKETVTVAPGQNFVTLTSFSRTEKFKDDFGTAHQAVTQLVFINRTGTDTSDVIDPWNVKLKYGYQDMYEVAPYYVQAWKTDKGSGFTVTFYSSWYGLVPFNGIVELFRLEAESVKFTATKGMSLEFELIHVQTGSVTVEYEVGPNNAKRTLVVDPAFVPVSQGKG